MKKNILFYRLILVFSQLLSSSMLLSQSIPPRLEPLVESNATTPTMAAPDEDLFEEASRFLKEPILLNEATKEDLQQLFLLPDALIDRLLLHRKLLGPLLHLNELQAIGGFTPELIRQLAPYVRVLPPGSLSMGQLISAGTSTQDLLLRVTGLFTGASKQNAGTWAGSAQRLLLWHRLQTRSLQAGWIVEKDPGEALLQRGRPPIDHSGFHFFWRGPGLIRAIALGDYTVNLGQGLLHWQSMAFGKSAEMSWIKRQGAVLRPHRSSGEVNFHRGLAATLNWKPLTFTFFVSRRLLSGRLRYDSAGLATGISSIGSSGYHRTPQEQLERKSFRQWTAGARVSARLRALEISLNAVRYCFSLPLIGSEEPRNKFDSKGRVWHNSSIDFSYTRKNVHFFGEGALAAGGAGAWVIGLMATATERIDLFALVRNNGIAYRALYANAFSESSSVENERGLYTGITWRPHARIRLEAYADHCVFPWIRYGAHSPTAGADYLLQLDYRLHKRASILIRYRHERKWEVATPAPDSTQIKSFAGTERTGWRAQLSYQFTLHCRLRTRIEWLQVGPWPAPLMFDPAKQSEEGFLYYADLLFNRLVAGADLLFRYQYFDTNSYLSRIYALSPDLRPGFGIRAFFGTGHQFWIGVDKELKFNILLSINSQFSMAGSSLQSRELRLQLRLKLH